MNKSSWLLIILTLATSPAVAGSATDCLDAQRAAQKASQIYDDATKRYLAREFGITDSAAQRLAIAAKAGVDPKDSSDAAAKAVCPIMLRI